MNVNCKDYQRQISLLLYDELAEGARQALETHLLSCEECKDALAAERTMHSVLADDTAGWDVPSDLLVESRKALADELDHIEKKRSWWKVPTFSVVFTPMRLLESAALIAMGLAMGVYVSNQQVRQHADPNTGQTQDVASALPRDGAISNLQVVSADPTTGQVELAGEVSRPLRFQGRMDDDAIRQILFSALRDPHNPGSRLKAVEVLSQKPTDEMIEEALITALVYDDDAGVRMRALEGLKTYSNEKHVLAAFMHTLQNDENAGIRVAAIDSLLARNPKDSQFAEKLTEATKKEDNQYIRQKVSGLRNGLQFVGNTK